MNLGTRIAIGIGIFLVDFATPFIPMWSIVLAIVVIGRPAWALEALHTVYGKEA